MTPAEAEQKIRDGAKRLEQAGPRIAQQMGQTGLTLLKERSIGTGISVDGSFAEYSTKPVYKSSMKNKARNAAGSAYASSGGMGTWGDFRSAQGLDSSNVNLFYSGRMWTALRVVSQQQNGHQYSVLVSCSDNDALRIIEANIKRYGDFLRLKQEEQNLMKQDAEEELNDLLRSIFS